SLYRNDSASRTIAYASVDGAIGVANVPASISASITRSIAATIRGCTSAPLLLREQRHQPRRGRELAVEVVEALQQRLRTGPRRSRAVCLQALLAELAEHLPEQLLAGPEPAV